MGIWCGRLSVGEPEYSSQKEPSLHSGSPLNRRRRPVLQQSLFCITFHTYMQYSKLQYISLQMNSL